MKKLLCLLLVVLFYLSTFFSCTQNNFDNNPADETPTEQAVAEQEQTTVPAAEETTTEEKAEPQTTAEPATQTPMKTALETSGAVRLELICEKDKISIDEVLIFSAKAYDKDNNEIKDIKIDIYEKDSKSDRYKQDIIIAYNQFRPALRGYYTIYAKYMDLMSETKLIHVTEGKLSKIELNSNKLNIKNDDTDSAFITAGTTDRSGNIVDVKVTFYEGEKKLGGNSFTSTEDGIHIIHAEADGIKSNYIAIGVNSDPIMISPSISASRLKLNANIKGDTAILNSPYGDITYYEGSTKLQNNMFTPEKEGFYYVYGVDGKNNVSNTLTINCKNVTISDFKGESDLPIIIIDTYGAEINGDDVEAFMNVFDSKPVNRSSDKPKLSIPITIKQRGQSSMTFPKKQYGITTKDMANDDNSVEFLGMAKENAWVLNGSYADKSLLRNYLGFEFFRPVSVWAPHSVFCEVYINTGNDPENPYNYMGIYSLIEKIKIDKSRLNIDKLKQSDESGEELTGGYIVAKDKKKPDDGFFATQMNDFVYVSPSDKKITKKQKDYISGYVNKFVDAVYSSNFDDPQKGYAQYIDIDSTVTSLCINELLKSIDGFSHSMYYYKPRGDKLYAGPPWDFDLSAGNVDFRTGTDPVGWYVVSWDVLPRRLMEGKNFVEAFKAKWKELRAGTLSDANIDKLIDNGIKIIDKAKERSFARWPNQWNGNFVWPNPMDSKLTFTYDDEIRNMKDYLHGRVKWIDENIDKPIDLTPVKVDWIDENTGERRYG